MAVVLSLPTTLMAVVISITILMAVVTSLTTLMAVKVNTVVQRAKGPQSEKGEGDEEPCKIQTIPFILL